MSVLRKYGAGLALVGRTLLLELFGKRLKTGAAAPTNGQALVYSAADDAWQPGTVSGGSLPSGALGSILVHDGAAWAARAIGTNGHVLRVVSGEPQWSALTASDVGAIAAPGSPISGGLLYYAGSWQSTAAGSLRQPMLSGGGAIAPAWGADVVPLTQRAVDALSTSVTTCAVLAHDLSGGGGGNGIGARCEMQARNSASTLVAAVALDGVLTNATAGAEAGALAVSTRTAGGALTERVRVHGTGGVTVGTTTALSSGLGLASGIGLWGRNAADSAWINAISLSGGEVQIGDSSNIGVLFVTGATAQLRVQTAGVVGLAYRGYMTAASGVQQQLKLSEPIEQTGSAGWTLLDLSPTLTTQGTGTKRAISYSVSSTERFGVDESGCVVGLRLRRTAVTDAAHTVALLSTYVDMRGLTAARTVTGPTGAVEGTVVTITNGDGSASGVKTVTFAPASGTVNGSATHVAIAAAYGSCTYVYDGTNWTVIAKV